MRSSLLLSSALLVTVAACGDDGHAHPDAFVVHADATPDTPPPPPGCDYGELRDDTNDDAPGQAGTPEDTMTMYTTSTVLCGKLNLARYNSSTQHLDADAYVINVPTESTIYLQLYGAGLEALDEVSVSVYGGSSFDVPQVFALFGAEHAAGTMVLEPGTYEVYVTAFNSAAPASDVSYKVKLTPDTLETTCAPLTTGGYAEARDAATSNLGNDVVSIDWDGSEFESLTMSGTDQPEPTLLTIGSSGSARFTGTAEATNAVAASYKDRDTFEITTGPTTNELSIRAAFTGADADLDLFLFEKPAVGDTSIADISSSAVTALGPSEEVLTSAVKPNTTYWVWLGNWKDSTTAGVYSTTLCGRTYTAPAN